MEQEHARAMVHGLDQWPDVDLHAHRIGGGLANKRHDLVPGERRVLELRKDAGKEGTQGKEGLEQTQRGNTLLSSGGGLCWMLVHQASERALPSSQSDAVTWQKSFCMVWELEDRREE